LAARAVDVMNETFAYPPENNLTI